MDSKPWYLSKTIIAGGVIALIGVYELATGDTIAIQPIVEILTGIGIMGIRTAIN